MRMSSRRVSAAFDAGGDVGGCRSGCGPASGAWASAATGGAVAICCACSVLPQAPRTATAAKTVAFTIAPSLLFRLAREEIAGQLAVVLCFGTHGRVDVAHARLDSRQVGDALSVDVAQHLRDAQRQFALLFRLALRE